MTSSAEPSTNREFDLIEASIRDRCAHSISSHSESLIALSHAIHADPEVGFDEHRASARCADLLAAHGFRIERGVADLPTAFCAEYGTGPLVVAYCAEYDALPAVGHACGHNVIAAIGVGAAIALRGVADELGITVRVLGTPAEETGGGKITMIEAGLFDDVGLCLMAHPAPQESCAPRSLAMLDIDIGYHGRASHAAYSPQSGINAADALTIAQVAVGLARQHFRPGEMAHGIVTHGGDAPNVIPAETSALYYLRANDLVSLENLQERIMACLQAGATATGCTLTASPQPAYTELRHDEWLVGAYRQAAQALGRPLIPMSAEREIVIGSTDMGNVSHLVPSIHPLLAIEAHGAVNHQPEFADACASASADLAVLDGALSLAWVAAAAASDPTQRARLLRPRAKHTAVVPPMRTK